MPKKRESITKKREMRLWVRCLFGFHDWKYAQMSHAGGSRSPYRVCNRCLKRQTFTRPPPNGYTLYVQSGWITDKRVNVRKSHG